MSRGTDVTRTHCTWRRCLTPSSEELPWSKGANLDLVVNQAFRDWINWDATTR